MSKRIMWRIVVAALLWGAPGLAVAQGDYPSRTIKIIVPLVPGGAADVVPRIIAEKLTVRFGHPVVIENRPGANGNIGAEAVAKAEPDGYTLLATVPGPLVINQSLYPKLGFEPRAFVPVTVTAALQNLLLVHPKAPYSTLQELVAFAKANPGKLTYGSPGVGSSPHLATEWIKYLAGIRITHVPYNGIPPAIQDVVAGHVDITFANTFTVLSLVKEGRLRALGVDSADRIAELPDLPTIAETFPGYVVTSWFAIVAPPKTSREIASKLSTAIAEVLKEPDVAKKLRDLSATPIGTSPLDSAAFIQRESERWHQIVVSAGLNTN